MTTTTAATIFFVYRCLFRTVEKVGKKRVPLRHGVRFLSACTSARSRFEWNEPDRLLHFATHLMASRNLRYCLTKCQHMFVYRYAQWDDNRDFKVKDAVVVIPLGEKDYLCALPNRCYTRTQYAWHNVIITGCRCHHCHSSFQLIYSRRFPLEG